MRELVSIVVPIYDVQEYLDKCVQSIIHQTYTDLEIILVDDGSPDGCGDMCDQYACKDNRIKVIHKKNGGLSDARNRGIASATGKFITFIDPDDYIHYRFIEILMELAVKKHADIVVGDLQSFEDEDCCKDKDIGRAELSRSQTLTSKYLYNKDFIKAKTMILTVACGKLYEKKLFEGIEYPVGKIHEDTFTTYKLMERSCRVVYLQEPLYYWRQRKNSITHGKWTFSHLAQIEAFGEQLEYYHSLGKQRYVEIVLERYIESFFWCYNHMMEQNLDLRVLRPYVDKMKKYVKSTRLTKSLGLKQWLRYRYLVHYKIPKLISR